MLQVYGIKNCNTVKKALTWLSDHQKSFVFHDYKKEPATVSQLEEWGKYIPYEELINKRGTTWRKLPTDVRAGMVDAATAYRVLSEHNSMIKRPIIAHDNGLLIGFDEEAYRKELK